MSAYLTYINECIRTPDNLKIQILKLTSECKFEYMPRSMINSGGPLFSLPYSACQIINNTVWLCFNYFNGKNCKTWAENKYGDEDFDSHINHWKGSLASYENKPFVFGGLFSKKSRLAIASNVSLNSCVVFFSRNSCVVFWQFFAKVGITAESILRSSKKYEYNHGDFEI